MVKFIFDNDAEKIVRLFVIPVTTPLITSELTELKISEILLRSDIGQEADILKRV